VPSKSVRGGGGKGREGECGAVRSGFGTIAMVGEYGLEDTELERHRKGQVGIFIRLFKAFVSVFVSRHFPFALAIDLDPKFKAFKLRDRVNRWIEATD
jgi:hypothetical protein